MSLKTIIILLDKAVCPEDIFGVMNGEPLAVKLKKLAKQVHPDLFLKLSEKAKAEEAFKRLQEWYDKAEEKVAAGTYGDKDAANIVINTKADSYTLKSKLSSGDISDVYTGENKHKRSILAKIVRTPANNDLAANEAKVVKQIKENLIAKSLIVEQHIPDLLDSFELNDGKLKKRVNIFLYKAGGYTLAQVKQAYPNGVKLEDAAWMFNRILGALIGAHIAGIVHGSIIPDHVLIYPKTHNGILLDWTCSVLQGRNIKAISPSRKDFYPHEVLKKEPATFATDVYMAAKCLDFIVEKPTPVALQGFIRCCFLHQTRRPTDVGKLHSDFRELLAAFFGPPKFHEFVMPDLASNIK